MIEAEFTAHGAEVRVTPAADGRPVTFKVKLEQTRIKSRRRYPLYARTTLVDRYVVGCGASVLSRHLSFETAVGRALSRARRYERLYAAKARKLELRSAA